MRVPLFLAALLTLAACEKDTDTGEYPDADSDGFNSLEDCNDRDPLIYPGSMETCDGRDEDCDGEIDEGVTVTLYRDQDLDGWGDPTLESTGCPGTGGYATEGTDCDDDNDSIHPEAEELCDGVDNDCDGTVDNDVEYDTWYPDEDLDGYGDESGAEETCVQPGGYIATGGDCDDTDDRINPGMDERCNGVDDDCDGDVDENDAVDALTLYPDADGDGYGDAADAGITGCAHPSGYIVDHTDCDDTQAAINPGAQEVCDAADTDEDCDGLADDADDSAATAGMSLWHPDVDSDGFGATDTTVQACDAPAGHILDDQDCDDSDGTVNPSAAEACNAVDDDCDGLVDDADPSLAVGNDWYADADGDGYGDAGAHAIACLQPTGYVADATDCDDTDPALTTDCGGADTGDTGEVFTRDGHYEGSLVVDVAVSAMGWTDTCTGTAVIDIVSADATPITGTGTCTFAGPLASYGPQSGTFDGAFPSDPDASGNVTIGVLVTDTWDGSFTGDDTLEGLFDGTLYDASGLMFEYSGVFSVAR
ncbi:MAG: putative metal-binding motif-containing protein [Pseudomonadota bacterium]